jgi:AcrR family transcriptional regulator
MGRRPTIDRDDLLDAAEAVVAAGGAAHLTFDAVAERAGVSKGGLLHTFPSKDALLVAMVERLCARFEAAAERAQRKLPDDAPGRELQAHVLGSLTGVAHDPVSVALLAAVAQNLELLAPLGERYAEAVRRVSAGSIPHARAAVVCLAADGLWLFELLGISPLSAAERRRFIDELCRLAREGAQSGDA